MNQSIKNLSQISLIEDKIKELEQEKNTIEFDYFNDDGSPFSGSSACIQAIDAQIFKLKECLSLEH